MSLLKNLLFAMLMAAVLAKKPKLEPKKVFKRGMAERRIFNNEFSSDDYNIREIIQYPVGGCGPKFGKQGKSGMMQVQTFKNSDMIHMETQDFSDKHCKHRLGKPKVVHEFHDMKVVHSKHGLNFQDSYYKRGAPPITMAGLIIFDHYDKHCDPNQAPANIHFITSYSCTNNTISGNPNARSMLNYAEYGYVYEYSEPNCMGNSSYVMLPDASSGNGCWRFGPHSVSFQVNHYVYPVYPTEQPSMAPTLPQTGNPIFSVMGNVSMGQRVTYQVQAMSGGVFSLVSTSGDADLYINLGPDYPDSGNYLWFNNCGPFCEAPVPVYPDCSMGCMYFVSVFGFASVSTFSLDFSPFVGP